MASDGADNIKYRLRYSTVSRRDKRRQDLYNRRRKGLAGQLPNSTDFTEVEVAEAAAKIAGGSKNKEDAFGFLKAALMQDSALRVSFMKIEGALHCLVGHLLSQKSYEQLLAMECCCNLALGDTKTCYKLAKAATPYLITILQGTNSNLMSVAVQTVSNLSSSSDKTCELLKSQGILNAFKHTISFPELTDSTAKALVTFTKTCKSQLKEEDVRSLIDLVLPFFEVSKNAQWLCYQLSSYSYVIPILISKNLPLRILGLFYTTSALRPDNIMSITAQVRLLGNMSTDPEGVTALLMLENWQITLNAIKTFMQSNYKHLNKELFWALGNVLKHNSPEVQAKVLSKANDLHFLGMYIVSQRSEPLQRTLNN